MIKIREKSIKKSRAEKQRPADIEQTITDMELENIERDISLTDLELAVLELQQKNNDK